MKNINKRVDFLEDYWIVTFEGVVAALVVATLALIGVYSLLFYPLLLQVLLIRLLVLYKRLKYQTEVAIETNIKVSAEDKQRELTEFEKQQEKENYFNANNISRKINVKQYTAVIFLIISIFLVVFFQFKEEKGKKKEGSEYNSEMKFEMKCLTRDIQNLKQISDSLRKELQIETVLLNKKLNLKK